jgi:hypothetical protein
MVRLSSHGLTARALAVLALFSAAACADSAVAPTAQVDAAGPAASHSGNASHLHTGKYRVSGAGNATGRSGSAVLSAVAIFGGNGVTYLRVTSASVNDPARAAGELAKVQVKGWGPDGEKLFTQNFQRPSAGPEAEFTFQNAPPGSRFQVQANVRGIDRNRTDVVTVTATSVLGPALSTTIDVPDEVIVGVPTTITGTVRETNGNVGTTTSCVLYVDGREVDRVDNVWVDAGDEVSCAFTYVFDRQGEHDVRMSLVNPPSSTGLVATPPPASDQVSVVDPTPIPTWQASVMDRTVTTISRFDLTWWKPDGSHKEYEQATGESPRSQTLSLTGTLARATTFPLNSVNLAIGSNAAGTFLNATWNGLAAQAPTAGGQTCTGQLVPEQGGHFILCSTGTGSQGSTAFSYTRFAGTVTYHSRGFSRTWDAVTATETYWTWNDNPETYTGGGQMRNWGTSVGIQLSVTDGVGTFSVNAAVPLTSFDTLLSEIPYACTTEALWWLLGGTQTVCEGRTERAYGWSGSAEG